MLTTREQGGLGRLWPAVPPPSSLRPGKACSGRPPGTRLGHSLPHGPSDSGSMRGSVCLLGWAMAFLRGPETPLHMCRTRHAQTKAWIAREGGVSGQPGEAHRRLAFSRALAVPVGTSPCGQLNPNDLNT